MGRERQHPPVDAAQLQVILERLRTMPGHERSLVLDVLGSTMEVAAAEHSTSFADAYDLLIAAHNGQLTAGPPRYQAVVAKGDDFAPDGEPTSLLAAMDRVRAVGRGSVADAGGTTVWTFPPSGAT